MTETVLAAAGAKRGQAPGDTQLLARFDGDVELLQRLSRIFEQETPSMLKTLEEAIASRDAHVLETTAHKLLGSLGALGADQAASFAGQLESFGENSKFAPAAEAHVRLKDELDTLQSRLAVFN